MLVLRVAVGVVDVRFVIDIMFSTVGIVVVELLVLMVVIGASVVLLLLFLSLLGLLPVLLMLCLVLLLS